MRIREYVMGCLAIRLEGVLMPKFCSLTGYTVKAVQRKSQDGVWLQGKIYVKAPDGRITINLQEYYKWVERAV